MVRPPLVPGLVVDLGKLCQDAVQKASAALLGSLGRGELNSAVQDATPVMPVDFFRLKDNGSTKRRKIGVGARSATFK